MAKLYEVARLIRSKNAGPFCLTFDIMFEDPDRYRKVRDSGVLGKGLIARLYGVREEDVDLYHVDNALAIKISIPRPIASGDLADSDIFGGQQYAPLVDLEVPA